MGQRVSSAKLSSLLSWPPAEQGRAIEETQTPQRDSCRCVQNHGRQRRPVRRRLSLGSADDIPTKTRNFDTLSCFKTNTDSYVDCECRNVAHCCKYKAFSTNCRIHSRRDFYRSRSHDRATTFTMSSTKCECDDNTRNCNNCDQIMNNRSCGIVRNENEDLNACVSASRSVVEDDVRNGNDQGDGSARNVCVKSSSIDRYMSAITDRINRTHIGNESCRCSDSFESAGTSFMCNSLKLRTTKARNKLTNSKSCSKHLDLATNQDCFGCAKDARERTPSKNSLKKKRWVPKFGSKLTKNGKISVNGTNKSTDSGLDIAGSSNDPNCICTLYRKVDETCRISQNAEANRCQSLNGSQPLSLGFARDRDWSRTPTNVSNMRHDCSNCDGSHSNPNVQENVNVPIQQPFNFPNLPFNIALARVALTRTDTVYDVSQTNSNAFFQAIQGSTGNGIYASSNVYGTLQNGNASVYGALVAEDGNSFLLSVGTQSTPVIDWRLSAEDYTGEDCEERARIRRALEIAEGVEPPPGYRPHIQMVSPGELRALIFHQQQLATQHTHARIHTQVDYIHCLVPDLKAINNCSFYWGKMDRYEAERLLEGKPEGTFLLRDSAQEEYLFSVSFRKYGRSLHARIEQFNHKFSFDSHDPGVYAANTVTGLIEHYKDPACVMFFEPMLTAPLSRTYAFSLQHLCRAVIASSTTYDGINDLRLPQTMKAYLKEYHYRQRVRVKRFEGPPEGFRWEPEDETS